MIQSARFISMIKELIEKQVICQYKLRRGAYDYEFDMSGMW